MEVGRILGNYPAASVSEGENGEIQHKKVIYRCIVLPH